MSIDCSFAVQPMMYIPNQLIGAPVNTQVTMECTTEASPKVRAMRWSNEQYYIHAVTS